MDHLSLTQAEAADRLGKSRPYIANMLRLLNLPEEIKQPINDKKLSGAHGRTLLGLKNEADMMTIAKQVIKESWSVRQLEQYVKSLTSSPEQPKRYRQNQSFL